MTNSSPIPTPPHFSQSTESPTSVTYSLTTPNGFNILFTIRDEKVSELILKMEMLEPSLVQKGYKPQVRGYSKPYTTYTASTSTNTGEFKDSKCPLCGGPIAIGKTSGKPYCQQKCWLPENKHLQIK
jgi:hypothetical protein